MSDTLLNGGFLEARPSPAADWVGALPEDLRRVADAKGWREPADALRSYKHLEELLGADKSGRGLIMPRDENDREGYARLYAALGRPETADGYELGALLADRELDSDFMGTMAGAMHEAGLSKVQAHKLASAWQEQLERFVTVQALKYQNEKEEVCRTLSPARLETARRGFRFCGVSREAAAELEQALGPREAVEVFARIGEALAEDRPVDEARALGPAASPEGARRRLDRLLADPAYSRRYLGGDKLAFEEITELSRRASVK